MRWFVVLSLAGCVPALEWSEPGPTSTPDPDHPPSEPTTRTEHFTYGPPRLDLVVLADIGLNFPLEILFATEVLIPALDARGVDYHVGVADVDWDPEASGVLLSERDPPWVDRTVEDGTSLLQASIADSSGGFNPDELPRSPRTR